MKKTPSHFMISVHDMDKSVDFYQSKLGLELQEKNKHWSELSFLTLGNDLELALKKVDNEKHVGCSGIGLEVEDCEEATQHYESLGIEILTRCQDRGDIIITQFADPDGNVIWLTQRIEKQ